MKDILLTVESNEKLAPSVYLMTLSGCEGEKLFPGQFVNLKLDGFYLRRPISVCDFDGALLTIIYKTVGQGTEAMSRMKKGKELSVLLPLGNGYDLSKSGDAPLLVGGGVGVPPLYYLCKELKKQGKSVKAIIGFNTGDEVFLKNELEALGAEVTVTTVDGSVGTKGFVTAAMEDAEYSHVFTCGPEPMLKAVYDASKTSGQFSFEERMGCGFGACMGCTCKTKYGNKRICRDGPVLVKEEIIW